RPACPDPVPPARRRDCRGRTAPATGSIRCARNRSRRPVGAARACREHAQRMKDLLSAFETDAAREQDVVTHLGTSSCGCWLDRDRGLASVIGVIDCRRRHLVTQYANALNVDLADVAGAPPRVGIPFHLL